MVNISEIRPFLTLKGLTHGPKILARKNHYVALDSPQKFVALALIGAEIEGGIICPTPPDGVILRPHSSARVKGWIWIGEARII